MIVFTFLVCSQAKYSIKTWHANSQIAAVAIGKYRRENHLSIYIRNYATKQLFSCLVTSQWYLINENIMKEKTVVYKCRRDINVNQCTKDILKRR